MIQLLCHRSESHPASFHAGKRVSKLAEASNRSIFFIPMLRSIHEFEQS